MARFRRKPVELEGVQWFKLGDHPAVKDNNSDMRRSMCMFCGKSWGEHGRLETREGSMVVCPGSWVMIGVKGEHYAVAADIFPQIYEAVEDRVAPPKLLSCTCRCSQTAFSITNDGYAVECQNCGLHTEVYKTPEAAADAWNGGIANG